MLLEEEYSLGSRLSRVHRRHSDVLELIFIPGKVSMQVEQVGIWTEDISAWNEYMAAWTWCCSWSGSRSSKSCLCCMRAVTHSILASLSSSVLTASLRWWLADWCSSLAALSELVSAASLRCWLSDIRSSLASLLSFVSEDSLICWLSDIRSSLASLLSLVSAASLRCWLADIRLFLLLSCHLFQ